MFSRTYTPGPENSARFRSPRATPFSLDQSTSGRNFRNVVSEPIPIPDERMHIALGLQWRKLANRKIKQINALV